MIVEMNYVHPHFKDLSKKFQEFSSCLKSGCIKRPQEGDHNYCHVVLVWHLKDVEYWYAVVSWIFSYTFMGILEEHRYFELVLPNLPQHNSFSVNDAGRIHEHIRVLHMITET